MAQVEAASGTVYPKQILFYIGIALGRVFLQLLEGVEAVFDGPADRKDKAADEPQTAELYEQIGKLNMQLEWLKKKVAENGL